MLSSRSIKASSTHCCGGDSRPSFLGYLPPPRPSPSPWCLSLAGGGGVLTHLSMAAWLLRGRMEDNRIGNATQASSFPPASVSIYLPGAARIRVYAVGLCIFGPDLNASMRRRRRGGGADDFLGQVAGRGGSGRRRVCAAALDGGRRNTVSIDTGNEEGTRTPVKVCKKPASIPITTSAPSTHTSNDLCSLPACRPNSPTMVMHGVCACTSGYAHICAPFSRPRPRPDMAYLAWYWQKRREWKMWCFVGDG